MNPDKGSLEYVAPVHRVSDLARSILGFVEPA
jgi:hypothetical protein